MDVEVRSDGMTLEQLASKIKAEHRHVVQTFRKSLEHARGAGELLAEAREEIKNSAFRWGKWVEQECEIQERTASNYIRVFRRWDEIEKAGDVSTLTVRAALALLKTRTRPAKPGRAPLPLGEIGKLMDRFGISGEPDRLIELLREMGLEVPVAKPATAPAR